MDRESAPSRCTALAAHYRQVRAETLALVTGLSAEDCMVQSMADASPVKWHLAHTTWFFETFVLAGLPDAPVPFDPSFNVLFNSYYVAVGERHPRPERGVLSRPALETVLAWRARVDEALLARLQGQALETSVLDLVLLGLHHEQQHQELILTDIKHHFSRNPVFPSWRALDEVASLDTELRYVALEGGLVEIGHAGDGFCFDNERPRQRVWLEPFALADRPVTNAEYLAFIRDGGYQRPELWLSDGWHVVQQEHWNAPLYWRQEDGAWRCYTLGGDRALPLRAPVMHLSYYEAEAFARWAGGRLPTEAEWEHAALTHPAELAALFDHVWQWTASAYLPYPGFRIAEGAVGEYNGKFMVNQMVMRGGSVATPVGHARASYRNFFPPDARWQFAGLRLCR